MTVGFHSPMPPARTGVADYAAALLPALRRFGTVEVGASSADVHLYHLGNNQLHRDTYLRALAVPGVVVLHDAVLHHFFLGLMNEDSYVEEFVHNYGEWNRSLAVTLWRDRARSAADPRYFQYAMLRRIAETARTIVVHNPAAADIVHAHAPHAKTVEIPHFGPSIDVLPSAPEVLRLREEWGLRPDTFLFSVFGHLRESKRIGVVLRAYKNLRAAGRDVALLIAGEVVSPDLARAIADEIRQPGIVRIGFVPEREWMGLASATDACINLRYPAAGETSGITIRLMQLGKPVIITSGSETSRFPETTCLRVDVGPAEQRMLEEYMTWLSGDPEAARAIGQRAAAHIREHHSLDKAAAAYWEVLRSVPE